MDPNQLRDFEFFSTPNNQPFDLDDSANNLASSIWGGTTRLGGDASASGTPHTRPGSLGLDSFVQSSPSTAATNLSMNPPTSRSSMYSPTGQMLPTRASRAREGHERKRSRLSADASPLDSVDYWMQFDNDESLSSIPEGREAPRSQSRSKGKGVSMQSSQNPMQPLRSSTQSTNLPFKRDQPYVDDSALDNALSDDDGFSSINLADQLSKMDSLPPSEIPAREGLYSTPLSWERPQPGLRMDSLLGFSTPVLSEAEQRRLIAIAMNPGPSMGGLGTNLNLNFGSQGSGLDSTLGTEFGGPSSSMGRATNTTPRPKPTPQPRPTPPAHQKQSSSASEKGKEKAKPGDRTAHNDIERKYRTNLKDKISELRHAVPSLQTASEAGDGEGDDGEGESSQHSRGPKVSKGTVLTKATEYIHYLEKRNRQIVQEHQELSRRLQAFEQLLNATARPTFQMPNYSHALFDPRAFC